jgi:putative transposase
MARLARLIVPGLPHHVTQRGNGRAQTFFSDADYRLYRDRLGASCRAAGVEIWSWVLMPNQRRAESIGRPLGGQAFVSDLEARTGHSLGPGKRGPKPRPDRGERS